IEVTRVYSVEDARQFLTARGIDVDAIAAEVEGKFVSAFIRAKKPATGKKVEDKSCCAPSCCAGGETKKG
ncbi:MAG: hypothetical protein WB780_06160, partial [Candidatus Acidiferrales bacterium]